ncbi:MAG TPA: AI-2E family transporter [Methanotrichaceae archaeon]|nr:AI-2E family transporter [Methanotrichaceae archaeon]
MDLRSRFNTIAVALFVLSALVSIYLTKVFITTILLSVFMVYLLYPIYKYLVHLTKSKPVSAAITISMASSVILYLAFFVATRLMAEISSLFDRGSAAPYLHESNLSEAITVFLGRFLPSSVMMLLDGLPRDVANAIGISLRDSISAFVSSLPVYIAQLILLVFFTYYFFTDGRNSINRLASLMPNRTLTYHFLKELNLIYNIFFRIHFFVAMVSALLAMLGFFLMGISYPIMWGIILGFFALLPELGPASLFIPMSLYYLILGDITRALEIFIYGEVFLIFIPEYILRPRLVMIGASVHPVITILAFTAPIFVIGPSGVIIGPAIYGIALAGYRTVLYFRDL